MHAPVAPPDEVHTSGIPPSMRETRAARLWERGLPIIVGVTGQRFFDRKDPRRHRERAAVVERRLARVFERLDDDLPHVPKVLVTGAAMGTDLIAARLALARGSMWRVTAILALDPDLFRQDFEPHPSADPADVAAWDAICAAERAAFEELVADADRVRVLPPLTAPDGTIADRDSLRRRPEGYDKVLRRAHYEQVGQFIAEAATILVAVTDEDVAFDEIAERLAGDRRGEDVRIDGSTQRVIAQRLFGEPDENGRAVAARSSIVRRHWSRVHAPPSRSVWLIDPSRDGYARGEAAARRGDYPVAWLAPLDAPLPEERNDRDDLLAKMRANARVVVDDKHSSLRLPRAFQRFDEVLLRDLENAEVVSGFADAVEGLVNGLAFPKRERPGAAEAKPKAANPAIARLERARGDISRSATRAKTPSTRSFVALAALFLAAVLVFEVYAKFRATEIGLVGLYLVVIGLVVAVAFTATRLRFQPRAEDYRAVSEMLRVQIAWWSAGLPDRVDHAHLQGVDRDLARPRDGATTILWWAWLRGDWPSATPTVQDPPDWRAVHDWIGKQVDYFHKNEKLREAVAERTERSSWFLIAASGLLAGLISFWLAAPGSQDAFLAFAKRDPSAAVLLGLVVLSAVTAARNAVFPKLHGKCSVLISILMGTPAACGAGLMAAGLGHIVVAHDLAYPKLDLKKASLYAAIVLVVVLNAVAGAWRYLAEKLGWEAEALAYRDAYRSFTTARRSLRSLCDAGSDAPRPDRIEEARAIVRALGIVALQENEAWLKTRRERPLTPVAG